MELIDVAVFDNDSEAELARGLLEANGIRAHFAGGMTSLPARAVPLGTVLQVSKRDWKKASALLSQATKGRTISHADLEWNEQKKLIFRIRKLIIFLLLAMFGLAVLAVIIRDVWFRTD
jgi:hypothetical protein